MIIPYLIPSESPLSANPANDPGSPVTEDTSQYNYYLTVQELRPELLAKEGYDLYMVVFRSATSPVNLRTCSIDSSVGYLSRYPGEESEELYIEGTTDTSFLLALRSDVVHFIFQVWSYPASPGSN